MTQHTYASPDIPPLVKATWTSSPAARAIMLIALACFTFCSPAHTADPSPTSLSRPCWLRVLLDKIKADPTLKADCLAEGKNWAEKNRAEAGASCRQDPMMYRNGTWSFERKYGTRSVVGGRYVSIVRLDCMNTGGAHPNSDVNTILWYTTAKGVEPKLLNIGAVALAPSTEDGKSSGPTFHYPPYAVRSYAERGYLAFVPWEQLKSYLTTQGIAIFGGARPKADEKGDDDQP